MDCVIISYGCRRRVITKPATFAELIARACDIFGFGPTTLFFAYVPFVRPASGTTVEVELDPSAYFLVKHGDELLCRVAPPEPYHHHQYRDSAAAPVSPPPPKVQQHPHPPQPVRAAVARGSSDWGQAGWGGGGGGKCSPAVGLGITGKQRWPKDNDSIKGWARGVERQQQQQQEPYDSGYDGEGLPTPRWVPQDHHQRVSWGDYYLTKSHPEDVNNNNNKHDHTPATSVEPTESGFNIPQKPAPAWGNDNGSPAIANNRPWGRSPSVQDRHSVDGNQVWDCGDPAPLRLKESQEGYYDERGNWHSGTSEVEMRTNGVPRLNKATFVEERHAGMSDQQQQHWQQTWSQPSPVPAGGFKVPAFIDSHPVSASPVCDISEKLRRRTTPVRVWSNWGGGPEVHIPNKAQTAAFPSPKWATGYREATSSVEGSERAGDLEDEVSRGRTRVKRGYQGGGGTNGWGLGEGTWGGGGAEKTATGVDHRNGNSEVYSNHGYPADGLSAEMPGGNFPGGGHDNFIPRESQQPEVAPDEVPFGKEGCPGCGWGCEYCKPTVEYVCFTCGQSFYADHRAELVSGCPHCDLGGAHISAGWARKRKSSGPKSKMTAASYSSSPAPPAWGHGGGRTVQSHADDGFIVDEQDEEIISNKLKRFEW